MRATLQASGIATHEVHGEMTSPNDSTAIACREAAMLGEIRERFAAGPRHVIGEIVAILVLVVGCPVFASFLLTRPIPDDSAERVAGQLAVAVFYLAPLAGLALLAHVRRKCSYRLLIGENGFEYRYRGVTEVCDWKSVAAIRETFTENTEQTVFHRFLIKRHDGKEYTWGETGSLSFSSDAHLNRLGQLLPELAAKHGIAFEKVED
jgi:hypothetical protein